MAKNTAEAEVVITMNGQQAKQVIDDLTEQYNELTRAALQAKKEGKEAFGDELNREAKRVKKTLDEVTKQTKTFEDVLKNINSASLKDLKTAAKDLKAQISKLAPDTKEFVEKSKQLQQVNTRVHSLEEAFRGVVLEEKQASLSLKGLADGFNKYFGMVTAGIAAITGVSMAFRKSAEEAAQLDDVYSDVMKTTGLAHDEVQALDEALMQLDTRTSREQLLLLARDAGKLGISGKEDVLGFVRAADKIQVALGEDLGEGAIRNLGKIADVLGYTKTMGIEDSLLSIGSAVNAVGQASTASEAYLVDFTQRLAGVGAQTGISAANIIGFASGLDQSAMKVEMAATAFQTFITKLYEDPAKFAEYANMEVSEFSDLLKNDANTAIVTILKNLKDQDGFAALVPIFKDMGVDGARATSVLAAMASNLSAITDAQALANVEFDKATSLADEFNTKNNNMNASLDKAKKEFKNASIALGQSLNPVLLKSTNAITYLIKALASYGKEIKAAVISIAALTVLIKGQAIAEGVKAAALKVGNALQATGTVLSNKLAAAYYNLTGQTFKAAQAQQAANAAMSKSVYGVIAIAVASLAVAIAHFVKKQREANQELDYFDALEKRISTSQNEEISTVQRLINIVNDQNVSYWKRKEALDELKKIVPNYHASLTKEGTLINNNKEALDKYIENLKAATRMKILEEDYTDVQSKLMAAEQDYENATREFSEWMMNNPVRPFGLAGEAWDAENLKLSKAQKDAKKTLDDIQAKEKKLMGMIGSESKNVNPVTTVVTGGGGGGGGGGDKYSEALKALEAEQRAEENAIMQSYANREIGEMEFNAEMLRIKTDFLNKKLELAEQEKVDTTQIKREIIQLQLDANKAAAKAADEIAKEADEKLKAENDKIQEEQKRLETLAKNFLKSIETPDEALQIELQQLEEVHQAKLLSEEEYLEAKKKLEEKYKSDDDEDRLGDLKDWIEKSNQLISQASNFINGVKSAETAHAEAEYQAQLTAAGDNAQQREVIEARYEQRKLDIQKKYADADMVINIAKAIAAGALAVMQAFAQLGPIGGAVAAALVGATTAAEVATIIAQRNAIKSQTVSMPTSSASAAGDFSTETSGGNIGSRVVTGYARGGYTEDHTTLTTVGERGTEWIAPHWMVKQNPITFANLESYRRAGSHGRSGSVARGFADGGYTPSTEGGENGFSAQLAATLSANTDASNRLASLIEKGLHAYVVLSELNQAQDKQNRFNEKTSR